MLEAKDIQAIVDKAISNPKNFEKVIKELSVLEQNVHDVLLNPETYALFYALDVYRNNQGIYRTEKQESAKIFIDKLLQNPLAQKQIAPHINNDCHGINRDGVTLLHLAAQYHLVDVASSLISLGANVHQLDGNGLTPFFHSLIGINHFATKPNYCPEGMKTVTFLVSKGSTFDKENDRELMDGLLFQKRPDLGEEGKNEIHFRLTKAIIDGGKSISPRSSSPLSANSSEVTLL